MKPANDMTGPIRVEIFRTGTHKPMIGPPITFTADDLAKMAASYSEDRSAAPVVIGHPETDAPAYGWAKALVVENDKLIAEIGDIEPSFAEAVKAKRYMKISASLFTPADHNNPTPGAYYLKHIGFLGARAPAVSGLKRVSFSANEEGVLTFGGWAEGEMEGYYLRLLAEEQRDRAREENERFVEKMIGEGRVLPVHKENVLAFMDHLHGAGTFSFAETSTGREMSAPAPAFFRKFLSELPRVISFGEIDMGDGPDTSSRASGLKAPAGYSTSRESDELFNRATELARTKGISFVEAIDELTAR